LYFLNAVLAHDELRAAVRRSVSPFALRALLHAVFLQDGEDAVARDGDDEETQPSSILSLNDL